MVWRTQAIYRFHKSRISICSYFIRKRGVSSRCADRFLAALREAGKRVVLITNAHRDSLSLKMERIALAPFFDRLISSHDYGFPKEDQQFWYALQQDFAFDPTRTLFIDDSLPVLRSAQRYGVAYLLGVCQPDSRAPRKDTAEFDGVDSYETLLLTLRDNADNSLIH